MQFMLFLCCLMTILVHISTASGIKNVLVLGSAGNIGSSVKKWLIKNNYNVLEVQNRNHIDLRIEGALDVFDNQNVDFVYFLACEVGGSKFIASKDTSLQQIILDNNLAIYKVVFSWLKKHNLPFIFTSSYLQQQSNSYGTIKRLGEKYIEALNQGKIVRLWNIYGIEHIGVKSHVMSDWIYQCINEGSIKGRTDGMEERQFLYVDDCSGALGILMEEYDNVNMITDVSSAEWVSLRYIGETISNIGNCPIAFNDTIQSPLRFRYNPSEDNVLWSKWNPNISLTKGIELMISHYKQEDDNDVLTM